ncbi:MAG: YfhO family protein [Chloroflexi bacterium]|nr:YfhO family protein [Chloroflexota bacterium]
MKEQAISTENRPRFQQAITSPAAIAVLILSLLWVFFFWRLLTPTDEDRVIFPEGDFPLHYFSYSDYQVERLWDGEIPLWNPYNYGGDPFAANVQWAVWYPPRWIAALIAGSDGWSIEALQMEVAAHYWLISLMMYLYLRVLVKRPAAALIGSVLWTYGGYLTGYPMLQPSILEAVAWLPLLMLGSHLSVTSPRWQVRGILLGGVMIGLSFFGGHTQTTMQMTYLAGAYIVVIGWQNKLKWQAIGWRVALLGISGAAVAAVQLLPAVELTRLAYRTEDLHYLDKSVGFTFPELLQFLWPRLFEAQWWPLYLGVPGFLLAINAMLHLRKKYHFWLGVIVVCLWLALGGSSAVYDFFYVFVPGFNMFREQERAASLAVFALVVLATFQLDRLFNSTTPAQDPDERRLVWLGRIHLGLAGAVFFVFSIVLMLRPEHPKNVTANAMGLVALVSLMFTAWLIWHKRRTLPNEKLVVGSLLALIVLDLFTVGMKSPNFVPDTPDNRIQPPEFMELLSQPINDIQWHVDGAAGVQTYGTYWRIPDIYGTGPFRLSTTEKLRQIRVDRRWEVLAVRYVTALGEVPENVPLTRLDTGTNYDGLKYTLYELDDPRPFAHLVYEVRVSDDGEHGVREIMKEPNINLREIGVTDEALPFDLSGKRPADARVNAFKMVMPEYLEMEVSTPADALLTVAVANYPGWRAEVNGEKVDIVDTYAGLIGVPIRAGQQQKVTLHFVPMTVMIGGVITLLALILVVGYVVLSLRHS